MKTLDQLGVSTDNHTVRKAKLASALGIRKRARLSAQILSLAGLPLLLIVVVVSAVHAVTFFSGEEVSGEVKRWVSLGNIVAIDLLLVYLVVAEATLRLVEPERPQGYQVLYLRLLVALLNASTLLVEFGHIVTWATMLVPWVVSLTLILFLPFFFVAVPAVEEVRGRLGSAVSALDQEVAALEGALDGAVDPELIEARAKLDELVLKVRELEAQRLDLSARLDGLTSQKSELELENSDLAGDLRAARKANAVEQAELRRLLDEALGTVAKLAARLGEDKPNSRSSAAPRQVEARCDGCGNGIVGFGAVGTANREAHKHGGAMLCKSCRSEAKAAN